MIITEYSSNIFSTKWLKQDADTKNTLSNWSKQNTNRLQNCSALTIVYHIFDTLL